MDATERERAAPHDIENVGAGTPRYIRERWGLWYIVPGVLLVVIAAAGLRAGADARIALALPLLWIFVGWSIAYSKMLGEFMSQFARANNFEYYEYWGLGDTVGALFEQGHSRKLSRMAAGSYHGHPIRFFHYSFTLGSDRQRTRDFTVTEITLGGLVPNILVESRNTFDFMSFRGNAHHVEIPFESNFRDHFIAYTQTDFEIEAFEIFTPDVMEALIAKAKGFDFEFIENKLYVFKEGIITSRGEMAKLLDLAKYLIAALAPRLARLNDDVAAHHAVRQKAS